MLAIKLKTVGKKHQRTFRVIVQEAKEKLQGNCVEDLGWYNPHANTSLIKEDRAAYWIGVGAQPTNTVANLLKKIASKKAAAAKVSEEPKETKAPKAEKAESAVKEAKKKVVKKAK